MAIADGCTQGRLSSGADERRNDGYDGASPTKQLLQIPPDSSWAAIGQSALGFQNDEPDIRRPVSDAAIKILSPAPQKFSMNSRSGRQHVLACHLSRRASGHHLFRRCYIRATNLLATLQINYRAGEKVGVREDRTNMLANFDIGHPIGLGAVSFALAVDH